MIRSAAVSLIGQRLGNRTDLDARIIAEMQLAQSTLEEDPTILPWFLVTPIARIECRVEDDRLPLPSDFIMEHEHGSFWRYDSTAEDKWIEMKKGSMDRLKEDFIGTGPPVRYALVGNTFRLFPTPDKVYEFRMLYHSRDEVLTSDVENRWLRHAPELLISETGKVVASYIEQTHAQKLFEKSAMTARAKLLAMNVARAMANRDLFIGGEGY